MLNSDDPRYQYDRFGTKGARVGQAVLDILSTDQPDYTCEEILEGMAPEFTKEMEKTINENLGKYKNPFYVLVLTKKEHFATNVLRNWFIARQTAPYASKMMFEYPIHTKTLYIVNAERGDVKVCWSLPGIADCQAIAKNPANISQELVGWILDCFEGKLDKEGFDYLFK